MSPILTRMIGAGSAGSGFGFGRRRGGGGAVLIYSLVFEQQAQTYYSDTYNDINLSSYNLSGAFTMQTWVNPSNMTSGFGNQSGVIFNSNPGGGYSGPGFGVNKAGASGTFYGSGIVGGGSWNQNTWYHLAYVRNSSNTCYLYVDGISTGTPGTDTTNHSTVCRLGYSNGGYYYAYTGYLQNFEIYVGQKYNSNFTPPTRV